MYRLILFINNNNKIYNHQENIEKQKQSLVFSSQFDFQVISIEIEIKLYKDT
jgi:hypothetical protein